MAEYEYDNTVILCASKSVDAQSPKLPTLDDVVHARQAVSNKNGFQNTKSNMVVFVWVCYALKVLRSTFGRVSIGSIPCMGHVRHVTTR